MQQHLVAVEWNRGIEDAWANVATFVPKLLAFLLILIVGWFVAKAIGKILASVLDRVGFDKAVERGGIRKALEKSKYEPSDILGKVVFYAVFLFVLQMAFGVFGTNPVSDLLASVIAYLPRLFTAIIIVVLAAAVAAAVKEIVQAAVGGLSYGKMLATAASIAILVIGAFAALDQLEIAPAIVTGLFYAMLAIVVGSAVIAIGGGGIAPMRRQWEQVLSRIEDEAPRMRQEAQGSGERIRARGEQLQATAKDEVASSGPGASRTSAR